MFVDSLLIVSVSIVLNVVAEGLSWLLIYRHDQYKSLKRRIDNAHRKLEDTQSEREVKRLEAGLQVMNRDLFFLRMKGGLILMGIFMTFLSVITSVYEGYAVARLPFEPWRFLRPLSHRGLLGEDWYDCSAPFLYIMCSMGVRGNVQRLLGFAPRGSDSMNMFGPPSRSQ
eukprot:TRINITY_DN2646_c0_g1_i2.p2 TRINITY_DN2646_c0_g1~~TRINITY_DN2646_c0_g1_i2.p2  ORF type:complete len:170 (-),score=11.27 TRINITY_DN2646_c0_g1_i2:12-521(-)